MFLEFCDTQSIVQHGILVRGSHDKSRIDECLSFMKASGAFKDSDAKSRLISAAQRAKWVLTFGWWQTSGGKPILGRPVRSGISNTMLVGQAGEYLLHTPTLTREDDKHPLFSMLYTVGLGPMKEVLRTEGGVETNGLKKALHICRGRFNNYSADRPLFGNPKLVGPFWIPSHVRGSIEAGAVVKDYSVNCPNS